MTFWVELRAPGRQAALEMASARIDTFQGPGNPTDVRECQHSLYGGCSVAHDLSQLAIVRM